MRIRTVVLLVAAVAGIAGISALSQTKPEWVVDKAVLPAGVAPASDSIQLARGIAYRPDLSIRDGVIEVQLSSPTTGFAGVAFRMASTADYEIIYFSPSDDGSRWQTVQYQPVFEGETTWQLYRRSGYYAPMPAGTRGPLRIRLEISGRRADVYMQGRAEPLLRITELKREPVSGAVGVWAAGAESPTESTGFTALRVDARIQPALATSTPETASDTQLMRWRVSQRFAATGIDAPDRIPEDLDFASMRIARAEPSGLVNLTQVIGNAAGPQTSNVFGGAGWGIAYARVSIQSQDERTVRVFLSYSDGIGVYLNGRQLYVGRNDSDSRYSSYLGLVGPELEGVVLPLRRGGNDLVLAVTDKAFGWGFRARLDSRDGITVVDPSAD